MLPLCSMKGSSPTYQLTPNPNAVPQGAYANPFESCIPFSHEAGCFFVELNVVLAAVALRAGLSSASPLPLGAVPESAMAMNGARSFTVVARLPAGRNMTCASPGNGCSTFENDHVGFSTGQSLRHCFCS